MRPSVWVVPGYLVATLAVTWPLARAFRTALPAVFNSIDPLLQTFILGWDRHAFATGLLRVFDAPIFRRPRSMSRFMDTRSTFCGATTVSRSRSMDSHSMAIALRSRPIADATPISPPAGSR